MLGTSMPANGPIRRAHLVSPTGTGALTVLPDGTSVVVAGLDHWYRAPVDDALVDPAEFEVREWRLERALGISRLRLPPDFRRPDSGFGRDRNVGLEVPALRLPTWHYCTRSDCRRMTKLSLAAGGVRHCPHCAEEKGRRWAPLVQVPLVAACAYGHLQDFPWREWVHRSVEPECDRQLYLVATGGASLGAQRVRCDCGLSRTLAGTTEMHPVPGGGYKTVLSSELSDRSRYPCQGRRPWHGTEAGELCEFDLKGSQRAASNLYYSLVKSSIYLPRGEDQVPDALLRLLESPPLSSYLTTAAALGMKVDAAFLRARPGGDALKPYDDDAVGRAMRVLSASAPTEEDEPSGVVADVEDTDFRRAERDRLRGGTDTPELRVTMAPLDRYDQSRLRGIGRLTLVDRLRETRALWGFNRIFGESPLSLRDRKTLLRRDALDWGATWLPAYVVLGEGLYIEFDEAAVARWEESPRVSARAAKIADRFERVRSERGWHVRDVSARLVLVHTFAHIFMNELSFESGYSSAAIRERLYVSRETPMAGMLIYTAAGDAEGTMGGLVRLGHPGWLEPAVASALARAGWCSSDPVCMELGEAGQGPDSCNMAACHGCALVPETACEEYNKFLDRGLLVGTRDNPDIGFFSRQAGSAGMP
jgi:Domain of unknown function (DUF1998)